MRRSVLVLILLALASMSAFAVDGVVLLNQSVATAGLGGCDTPGFPITICNPGSYKLSGNLTIADANTTAIVIATDDVTIDLNGFSIRGPVSCVKSTFPVQCSATGSGIGITFSSKFVTTDNTTILNGTIRGMGQDGINLNSFGARIEGVHAESNGRGGIAIVDGVVTHCTSTVNALHGISTGADAVVTFNRVLYNGGNGINGGGTVTNNSVSINGQDGIYNVATAAYNTSIFNKGHGISAAGGMIGNVLRSNGLGNVDGSTNMGHNVCDYALCP
jgi:hypothetical protein